MDLTLREFWWVPLLRGIFSIAFGILLLVWPAASIGIVAFIFASLLAVYGILDIIVGVQTLTKGFGGILRILLGILEIWVTIYLFRNAGSGLTLALMGLLMAVVLVALSFVMIASALLSDATGGYRWAIGIAGAVTFFIGISVARAPSISIVGLIYVFGIFGLFVGPMEIATAFMLKNADKQ